MGSSIQLDPSLRGALRSCWLILRKYWVRWCKNSAVAAMLALGISSVIAAPQAQNWDTVAAAAIAAMGFANLDIDGKPLDERGRKLATAAFAVFAAGLLLFMKAGDEQAYVIIMLVNAGSVFLSTFAIQFVLATSCPSTKWPHTS